MNYGLYLSAGGAITQIQRQNVISNNLANVNTVGFKPDLIHMRHRLPERLEDNTPTDPKHLLEMLGGGIAGMPNYISRTQGSLQPTNNDLDLAIEGDGYFVVRSATGGEATMRLTRDGRLSMDDRGELVMATTGMRVLDVLDHTIRLDRTAPVEILPTGEIMQNGAVRATIQLVSPRDRGSMTKVGSNLLRLESTARAERPPATGRLSQRYVEASAVNPIMALTGLVGAAKSAMANIKMMQYHDHIMGQAINTMGRVA